jgi:hypothetical protein
LFCPGIPGAGKTILSSTVVADLCQHHQKDPDVAVAFFYCNYKHHKDQQVDSILLSILKQLAEGRPILTSNVQTLYDQSDKRRKRPLHEDIVRSLQIEMTFSSRTFLVIDALDECSDRRALISALLKIQELSSINLLVTSRLIPEIAAEFRAAETVTIRAAENDVQEYLKAQIHRLPRFVQQDPALQDEISKTIVKAVDGM